MMPARVSTDRWMNEAAIAAIVAALRAEDGRVRFVGGCVRDALLGREGVDIDLATPDAPERVMAKLARAGIAAVPTGIAHGTVTAVIGARHVEITTLRADVETFGRHARVAFTDDWAMDAARRDFTINALSTDPDGTLHDPFGGVADLRAGRVRFVGDARTRIREDVLRLLRFFRFHAYYGAGAPDADALAACRELAGLLPSLSGERVAGELRRLLLAPDPAAAIGLMGEQGVLAVIMPEFARVERLRALAALEREAGDADWIRRLAALIVGATPARAIAERLKLSNAERDRLIALATPVAAIDPAWPPEALRRVLHRHGAATIIDLALLAWAERGDQQGYRAILAAARAWRPLSFPLRGRDALDLGVPAGRAVGELMAAVEAWWADGDFRANRAACLDRLRALVRPPGSG